ncbi:MAG: hypothetical protein QNJ54_34165 [Prochloraceae cyanobacterium]|nr:hypothetical protein [Prochloraceae cyanobacterium]
MISQKSRWETWNQLLAGEIVNCWIQYESNLPSFNDFLSLLNILNLEGTKLLFDELDFKFDEIQNTTDSQLNLENLIEIQERFGDWYYREYLKKITLHFQAPQIEARDKFKKFVNSFWLFSSPKSTLDFLSKIEGFLISCQNKYQQEKQTLLKQENGGKKSFNSLTYKLIQDKDKSIDNTKVKINYDLASKALIHTYRYKLKSELCNFKIDILRRIQQDNQVIIENLIASDSFLSKFQESYQLSEAKTNLLVATLFEHICSVKSPESLKQELETHLGVPLNRWGSCGYISIEEVRRILLDKLSVMTKDAYSQLVEELTSEVKLKQQESNHFQEIAISN